MNENQSTARQTQNAENTEEIIGVLHAISVISKRMAKKLALLERRATGKDGEQADGSGKRQESAHAD